MQLPHCKYGIGLFFPDDSVAFLEDFHEICQNMIDEKATTTIHEEKKYEDLKIKEYHDCIRLLSDSQIGLLIRCQDKNYFIPISKPEVIKPALAWLDIEGTQYMNRVK